jgi:hypothetical protein
MISADRFTNEFQYLILFEDSGWAAWVPATHAIVESPVRMVYRRRHHLIKKVTATSKRVQELALITFEQSLVAERVIKYCLECASVRENYSM